MAVKNLDELEQLALKIFLNSNVSETNAAHVVTTVRMAMYRKCCHRCDRSPICK